MAPIGNGSTDTHDRDHEGGIAKPPALTVYGAGRFNADLLDFIRN